MYLESLHVSQLRVFESASVQLYHPLRKGEPNAPTLSNVNLLLGNNGAGKTTLMRAMALAALGPLGEKFSVDRMVRRMSSGVVASGAKPSRRSQAVNHSGTGEIEASFMLTGQDQKELKPNKDARPKALGSSVAIELTGDEEFVRPRKNNPLPWRPILSQNNGSFLVLGYGATRRMDSDVNSLSPQQRLKSMPLRHQRVASLFYDSYTLIGMQTWLGEWEHRNPGRFIQVLHLLNQVLPEGLELTRQKSAAEEFLFCQNGALVPFSALSDGPKAFIGWVMDLLYHINFGCPTAWKLRDNCGLVLVDEVDLHLHPEWQRTVIPKLATAFPNLQFIFTSHSPLVVGSLESANIWVCAPDPVTGASQVEQKNLGVHGLNADHILLTPYFGLQSSRSVEKQQQLDAIAAAAERGTPGKAMEFLRQLVEPMERSFTWNPNSLPAPAAPSRPPRKAAAKAAKKQGRAAAKKTAKKAARTSRKTARK